MGKPKDPIRSNKLKEYIEAKVVEEGGVFDIYEASEASGYSPVTIQKKYLPSLVKVATEETKKAVRAWSCIDGPTDPLDIRIRKVQFWSQLLPKDNVYRRWGEEWLSSHNGYFGPENKG
jgi:hypothetical protein